MQENPEKIRTLLQKALALPLLPGVYIMKDQNDEIIYIGKAKKLKNRVSSYFRSIHRHLPKVYQMVIRVADFEHILCDSEFEALVLECNLIKQYTPKYNILLKDDKGYHYLRLSPGPYPRITAVKAAEMQSCKDASQFIGPYMSAFAVSQMADDVNRIFKLPTCRRRFPQDFGRQRPCLRHHIGQCDAPCTGKISEKAYNAVFNEAVSYIRKDGAVDLQPLRLQMQRASDAMDFELAARLRDRIRSIEKIREEQKIFLPKKESCDFVALSAGDRKCCICVLSYRGGRLCDSSQHIFDSQGDFPELLSQFLSQFYTVADNIPRAVYVNLSLSDRSALQQLLAQRRGRSVSLNQPQKGEHYRLLMMAQNNAAEGLAALLQRDAREIAALDELTRLLALSGPPKYIESYDISNLGDKYMVAGMVVFENGRPLKKAYRKFTIKDQWGQDDYSAMRQALRRRFEEYKKAEDHSEGFGRLPDLILLDGGRGHVSAVRQVLLEMGISVPLFGMVKDGHHRTRAITGDREILIASSRSAFTLVSRIQDEVHRYTISFQQKRHRQASFALQLTQIDGIGPKRAAALLTHFRTLKALRQATPQELAETPGISPTMAQNIYDFLKSN